MKIRNPFRRQDPAWLLELDRRSAGHLEKMRQLPLVRDICAGKEKREGMASICLHIGLCLIRPFEEWLEALAIRAPERSLAGRFWHENRAEEREHWQWWMDMAAAYGVKFDSIMQRAPTAFLQLRVEQDLYKRLWVLSHSESEPLVCGLAGVNYVIETGAAELTRIIAPHLLPKLTPKEGRWIKEHARGDQRHSKISRRCLVELGEHPQLPQVVDEVYGLFIELLRQAYEEQE